MKIYNLTEEDKECVNSLLNISYSIYDSYLNLVELDNKGLKENYEYQRIINNLKTTIYLEESLYEKLGDNPIVLQSFIDYIINPEDSWDLGNELTIVLNDNIKELIRTRVYLKIIDKRQQNSYKVKISYDKEIMDEFNGLINISLNVKKDLINTILRILNLYLNDNKYESIFNKLNNIKYNLGFIYSFVEDELINNDFVINKNFYLVGGLYADLENDSENKLTLYQNHYASIIFDYKFEMLWNNLDLSINNIEYFIGVISQILTRASLLFINKELRNQYYEHYKQLLEIDNMLNRKNVIYEKILESFDKTDDDIKIPLVLRLRKGK